MLTGMFRDKDSTEGAYRSLRERGYTDDEINVMMSDETRDKYFSDGDTELEGNKALEGTGAGAAICADAGRAKAVHSNATRTRVVLRAARINA